MCAESLGQVLHMQRQREPTSYKVGQREYEFVAEVTSAPPNSVFRLTKVLPKCLQSPVLVFNQIKQKLEENLGHRIALAFRPAVYMAL